MVCSTIVAPLRVISAANSNAHPNFFSAIIIIINSLLSHIIIMSKPSNSARTLSTAGTHGRLASLGHTQHDLFTFREGELAFKLAQPAMLQTARDPPVPNSIRRSSTASLLLSARKPGTALKLRRKPLASQGSVEELSPKKVQAVAFELDVKLAQMQEVARSDRELLDLQRKALFLQRLEHEALQLANESLTRNYEALSHTVIRERAEHREAEGRMEVIRRELEEKREEIV